MEKVKNKDLVQSVIRSTMILELLSQQGEMGISDISVSLGLERTTVSRMVGTLRHLGYIKQNTENHKYSVTLKLFEMGMTEIDRLGIIKTARPYLEELSKNTDETVNLGILSGAYALYIDTVQSPSPIKADWGTGSKMPVHASALGKVLLAFQKDEVQENIIKEIPFLKFTSNTINSAEVLKKDLMNIRNTGYAVDDEESLEGLTCFAAPLLGFRGEAIASVSLAFPKYRYKNDPSRRDTMLSLLLTTSSSLSRELGFSGFIPT